MDVRQYRQTMHIFIKFNNRNAPLIYNVFKNPINDNLTTIFPLSYVWSWLLFLRRRLLVNFKVSRRCIILRFFRKDLGVVIVVKRYWRSNWLLPWDYTYQCPLVYLTPFMFHISRNCWVYSMIFSYMHICTWLPLKAPLSHQYCIVAHVFPSELFDAQTFASWVLFVLRNSSWDLRSKISYSLRKHYILEKMKLNVVKIT